MSDPRTQAQLPHRPTGRHAAACLLVLALVWAQSLGLWHSVVHWDSPLAARSGIALSVAQETGQAVSVLQRLSLIHI